MGRKNAPSDKEQQELDELIANYEAAKKENKQFYLDGDQLADIADKYAADRRFDEAQEAINYGLELHPAHTDLLIQQAYLYMDIMDIQKAKNVAECITETYNPEVKVLKAEILLNEGNLDKAEELLNSIDDKESFNTILNVSYLYMDMGYPEKALPWLTNGLKLYKDDEDFLAAVADCYRSGENTDKAIYFYNKLIDKNPYDPSYWTGLAKCHFNLQEYDKAIEACDFALAADENFGEAHTTKAHCLFYLENEEEAVHEYQLALQNNSLSPDLAHMFIGLAYANLEKWESSYKSYEDALNYIGNDNSPILVDIYSNMAFCLSKLGRYKEAHLLCKKALKKLPQSVDIYLQEGRIYLDEDNFEGAKRCWDLALRCAPEAETLMQIGGHSLDYGMVENARLCFEQAKNLDPEYPGINGRLASVCMLMSDHDGFYRYNQLAKNPINLEGFRKALVEKGNETAARKIEEFMSKSEKYKVERMNEKESRIEDDDEDFDDEFDDDDFDIGEEENDDNDNKH